MKWELAMTRTIITIIMIKMIIITSLILLVSSIGFIATSRLVYDLFFQIS